MQPGCSSVRYSRKAAPPKGAALGRNLAEKIEKIMMAVTFAEAGEHGTAREIMRKDTRPDAERPALRKHPRKEYRAAPPQR
ncbi:MAG: hypothetical protein OHK006_01440 [Thermodesulfovibrionales bacterium]